MNSYYVIHDDGAHDTEHYAGGSMFEALASYYTAVADYNIGTVELGEMLDIGDDDYEMESFMFHEY